MPSGFAPLFWFIAIVAMIPLALWLLKRTPIGGGSGAALMRSVAVLPLSPAERVVTIEVGEGEQRRWLVLGVTPTSNTTLHTMAPLAEPAAAGSAAGAQPGATAGFAQLLAQLRKPG